MTADKEQDIPSKEKILADLEDITVLSELEEAGKRHPVFAKVKKHLINVVKGDSLIDTMEQKPAQLKELKRLVCVLDDVKKRDKAAYQLLEVVYGLALDAHHSDLYLEMAPSLIKYIKLLVVGNKNPEVPEFENPHLDLLSRELCGLVKQITTEYKKRIGSAATEAFKMIQAGEREYHNKPDQHILEPIYELARLVESEAGKEMEGCKEKEVKDLEAKLKRYKKDNSPWTELGIFSVVQTAVIGGFVFGVSKVIPNSEDYVKALVTAACTIPSAFAVVGGMISAAVLYDKYLKRKE